ncbi:uncharacterized protein BO72DRAFT_488418 [Aspergillus fijiensis CBS 313.89]|uniref:Uncharacterized protein n=1 Tax=Aspergillus fijiensis CBS 313.89 TaxID=1448319 RepID=A0A8G1RKZ1_9EURO|nr:uncharacterized protein BO72DRAFT_488418 [Aspergillus fijiensis CBS 313.89]RAK74063.1 hypothetical protein BO72DRAFT_488418 [Aspergillus fijiensis CBS 313.89]
MRSFSNNNNSNSDPESVSPLVSPETTPTKKPLPAPARMRGHINVNVNVKPTVQMRGARARDTEPSRDGATATATATTRSTRIPRTEAEVDSGTGRGRGRTTAKTAELSDTGFYRQRAELPARMERELINVPWSRRRWEEEEWEEGGEDFGHAGGDSARARERKIVTADGAVMVASIQTLRSYSEVHEPRKTVADPNYDLRDHPDSYGRTQLRDSL